ncbi:gamma-parvin isoform X6 [Canis lupus familiaris]|uniref:gamma-parvin isoform X6 n=1 Tax=Canis lupus familiaris TaxID=9615 RepID=UPI0018F35655|nr:gamma-parvin isoform X6 [Canis lupus familiaris]
MNSELREGSPLALSQSLGQQGGVSPSDTLVHADELSVSVSGSPYPARPSPLLKATARATRLSSDCLACWGPRALLLRGGAGVENLTQSQRKTIQDKKNRVKEARHRGVRTVRFFTDVDSQTGKTNARWEEAQRCTEKDQPTKDVFDELFKLAPEKVNTVKEAIVNFVNQKLDRLGLSVQNLDNQFADGVFLLLLIGQLEGFFLHLKEFYLTPTSPAEMKSKPWHREPWASSHIQLFLPGRIRVHPPGLQPALSSVQRRGGSTFIISSCAQKGSVTLRVERGETSLEPAADPPGSGRGWA